MKDAFQGTGSLSGLTLPGHSAGVVPRNTVALLLLQRWSGMKRKVIFQQQALMSQDEGFFQRPEIWYLGPQWELWAPPSEAQQFLQFSRSSLANETKAEAWALGVTTDLIGGFSPPVWDLKPQPSGHAPVWISRLGLADFPLPLQLNKVFLQTSCPNLC